MNQPATTDMPSLRAQAIAPRHAEAHAPVAMGFGSLQSFELMQRAAKLLASSTLVPAAYRSVIEKTDRYGNVTDRRENPSALANAVVALNMSQRMGADPLMVMQNLYIVEGRPSWSSQWIIAAINGCGRFSPLRFDIKSLGKKKVDYVTFVWENKQRQEVRKSVEIEDKVCVAWAVEKETGARIESPAVSIEMAVKEGWFTKNGSKWQTMDEVMLRYRTASFFGKLYAPELLMGLQTVEEAQDIVTLDAQPDGTYVPQQVAADIRDLRSGASDAPAPSVGETIDTTTGEIIDPNTSSTDSQNQVQVASEGPTFADAHAAVREGDFDLARDIARGLSKGQREQIETTIANLQQSDQPQQATSSRRGRGNLDIG